MTSYKVTTTKSWFERAKNSFGGIIIGIIFLIIGTILLWWNEGNFVKTQAALKEAQSVTRELGNIDQVDSSLGGQLVHATGPANTEDRLEDPFFGVSTNAIRLERTVEYYQWEEEKKTERKKKLGGGEEEVTTYTYSQKWVNRPVDSTRFAAPGASEQHKNFVYSQLEDLTVQAKNVTVGAYRLPAFLIESIRSPESFQVELSDEVLTKLNEQLAPWLSPPSPPDSPATLVHVSDNTVYIGPHPASPGVADTRITFKQTLPTTVSFIAKLVGDTFETYVSKNGRSVSMLSVGTHSAENMYESAHTANTIMTWILRFVGVFLVCISLVLITAPLSVLASIIPFLGSIVGAGTALFSLLFGLAWSLLIIAIAWLFYRPLIGIILLMAVVALVAMLYSKGQTAKNEK